MATGKLLKVSINPPRQAPQTTYNKTALPSGSEIDQAPHHHPETVKLGMLAKRLTASVLQDKILNHRP
jgi:hypothetical protein